jgi:hypothetical protein
VNWDYRKRFVMEVVQYTENDKKVITIQFPIDEDYKIQILKDKVVFKKIRSFSEISDSVKNHLKKNYSDKDIDLLVKQTREKLWASE